MTVCHHHHLYNFHNHHRDVIITSGRSEGLDSNEGAQITPSTSVAPAGNLTQMDSVPKKH